MLLECNTTGWCLLVHTHSVTKTELTPQPDEPWSSHRCGAGISTSGAVTDADIWTGWLDRDGLVIMEDRYNNIT